MPVNVVDRPELSNFITPAIVDRDPVTVAIGTEGAAPVLARAIKADLDAEGMKDMGRVMGELKARHGASLDMSRASALVKESLS